MKTWQSARRPGKQHEKSMHNCKEDHLETLQIRAVQELGIDVMYSNSRSQKGNWCVGHCFFSLPLSNLWNVGWKTYDEYFDELHDKLLPFRLDEIHGSQRCQIGRRGSDLRRCQPGACWELHAEKRYVIHTSMIFYIVFIYIYLNPPRVWNLGPEKPIKNRPFGAEIWHPWKV